MQVDGNALRPSSSADMLHVLSVCRSIMKCVRCCEARACTFGDAIVDGVCGGLFELQHREGVRHYASCAYEIRRTSHSKPPHFQAVVTHLSSAVHPRSIRCVFIYIDLSFVAFKQDSVFITVRLCSNDLVRIADWRGQARLGSIMTAVAPSACLSSRILPRGPLIDRQLAEQLLRTEGRFKARHAPKSSCVLRENRRGNGRDDCCNQESLWCSCSRICFLWCHAVAFDMPQRRSACSWVVADLCAVRLSRFVLVAYMCAATGKPENTVEVAPQ